MALDVTPEQRETGKANFARAAEGLTRRGFMKSLAAGAAVLPITAAAYFGYRSLEGRPVKAALIGGGDEGGVLVGEHNPEYLEFIAVADIRPSNMRRIFEGDPKAIALRKGFKKIYGSQANDIRQYTDFTQMLKKEKDIEAVVIALPLHLHAPVAIAAMHAGQSRGKPIHVLCEKLMAWDIASCKKMIKVAEETNSLLSIGHQRHYSLLYAHASELINSGILGDIKHIRALWHRNNSWPWVKETYDGPKLASEVEQPFYRDGWFGPILQEDYDALRDSVMQYGFDNVEQLVRWRLYNATGGGLMAELGSHQLDACSIFLGHVHPLAVSAVGGKYFYRKGENDRNSDDHVFVTYEFPGKNHPKGPKHPDGSSPGTDEDDIVVVTYSSVNTSSFEKYGECVMGSRGTLLVEKEESAMLWTEPDPNKNQKGPAASLAATVSNTGTGKPALESSSTWGPAGGGAPPAANASPTGSGNAVVSRGYREEMEDFAYCVRLWEPGKPRAEQRLPKCHGEVAMADAIVALTANHAMRKRQRIVFNDAWFDPTKLEEVPDDPTQEPKIKVE
jgi:predicted dehydrogenase